jgi:hypothetical protein
MTPRFCVPAVFTAAILSFIAGHLVFAANVQDGNFRAESPDPKPKAQAHSKRNSYPFSGELESHDSKIIALKGKRKARVLLLTSETRVLKNGASAKLDEAVAGTRVTGSARKNAEGKEEAVTINLKETKGSSK